MIQSYTFNKKIRKNGNHFQLEIVLPNNFNNIEYKIYGDEGFFHHGLYKSIKNVSLDNILIIIMNKIQNLFINIKSINDDLEYFDFFNYNNNDSLKKNIKIDIKRKVNNIDDQANIYLDNIIIDEKEDDNISKKNISSHDLFNYFVKKNNESSDDEDDESEVEVKSDEDDDENDKNK
jgi:hypothetical protein